MQILVNCFDHRTQFMMLQPVAGCLQQKPPLILVLCGLNYSFPMVLRTTLYFAKGKDANNTGFQERMGKSLWLTQDWIVQAVEHWGTMGIPGPEARAFQRPRCMNEPLINAEQGVEKWELNGFSPTHNLALFSAWELTFESRHCPFNLWSLNIWGSLHIDYLYYCSSERRQNIYVHIFNTMTHCKMGLR